MNRTILLAIGGLAVGLALSTVGTLLLGAARAVAKHVGSAHRRTVADLRQYAAALSALLGFLLIAGGGALLSRELMPLSGPADTVLAAGVGVLLFAAAGAAFSRVGDHSEEAKARRLPAPAYQQVRAPEPPPAHAATKTPAAPNPPPPSLAASTPAAATPATPNPAPESPVPPTPAPDTPAPDSPAPPRASARRPVPPAEDSPTGTSIADSEALLRAVRPGWIYRDRTDRWYLGVVDEHTGGLPLLRLPDFSLVAVAEPAYPLTVAGAGEIAVVPLPAVPATPTEDGSADG